MDTHMHLYLGKCHTIYIINELGIFNFLTVAKLAWKSLLSNRKPSFKDISKAKNVKTEITN